MAEIKCSRCDRRYSSFRSRCPYCKTRRSKSGKRVEDPENAKWKYIIGVLLVVILAAAVIVLIATNGGKEPGPADPSPSPSAAESEGAESLENEPLESPSPPPVEVTPEAPPEPVITTESAQITWNGNARNDVTMSRGEILQFGVRTVPAETEDTPVWSTDKEDVIIVLQTGKVTAVGKGTANLTVTCGAATSTCIIRVN